MLTLWPLYAATTSTMGIAIRVVQIDIVVIRHGVVRCLELIAILAGILEQDAIRCWCLRSELRLVLSIRTDAVAVGVVCHGLLLVPIVIAIQEAIAVGLKDVWGLTAPL